MTPTLERALRRVCKADGHDPDQMVCGEPRWRTYIDASQRSRIHAEIDAERNRGLLCIALGVFVL